MRGNLASFAATCLLAATPLAACQGTSNDTGNGAPSAAPTSAGTRAAGPPNIIYIYADDLGYNEVGAYGQDKIPARPTSTA